MALVAGMARGLLVIPSMRTAPIYRRRTDRLLLIAVMAADLLAVLAVNALRRLKTTIFNRLPPSRRSPHPWQLRNFHR